MGAAWSECNGPDPSTQLDVECTSKPKEVRQEAEFIVSKPILFDVPRVSGDVVSDIGAVGAFENKSKITPLSGATLPNDDATEKKTQPPEVVPTGSEKKSFEVSSSVPLISPKGTQKKSGKELSVRSTRSGGSRALKMGLSYMFNKKATINESGRTRIVTSNSNRPVDYVWIEGTIDRVVSNEADTLGCKDMATGKPFTPLFFVAGACPSMFAGMQIVMYAADVERRVDFWWVKPAKGSPSSLEQSTLSLHVKGPFKNDPGRSKSVYKPLADFFATDKPPPESMAPGMKFGIDVGTSSCRAFIEKESSGQPDRMYVYLIWIEDWSSPWSRSRYLRGRLVYQKDPQSSDFFSRQFDFENGVMKIPRRELEESAQHALPGDEVKVLYEMLD